MHEASETIYTNSMFPLLFRRKISRSYRSLSPKTRLLLGVGLMTYAGIGMYWTPKIEEALGMVPTKQEQEELDRKTSVRILLEDKPDEAGR